MFEYIFKNQNASVHRTQGHILLHHLDHWRENCCGTPYLSKQLPPCTPQKGFSQCKLWAPLMFAMLPQLSYKTHEICCAAVFPCCYSDSSVYFQYFNHYLKVRQYFSSLNYQLIPLSWLLLGIWQKLHYLTTQTFLLWVTSTTAPQRTKAPPSFFSYWTSMATIWSYQLVRKQNLTFKSQNHQVIIFPSHLPEDWTGSWILERNYSVCNRWKNLPFRFYLFILCSWQETT